MIRLDVVILHMALSQLVLALTCRSVVVWQWLPWIDCGVVVVMISLDVVILDMALTQLVLALMQVRCIVAVVTIRLHAVWCWLSCR